MSSNTVVAQLRCDGADEPATSTTSATRWPTMRGACLLLIAMAAVVCILIGGFMIDHDKLVFAGWKWPEPNTKPFDSFLEYNGKALHADISTAFSLALGFLGVLAVSQSCSSQTPSNPRSAEVETLLKSYLAVLC
uniref:Uncharacterized protein n=1 Tax=Noctiluca scintillans TaxID=2966 RepID=A0A7S0ZPM7_NOCSC|mmetsp:Transcript_13731/g.37558  ORF Transcript_13731/g.37558 Transcript_13731/m.37558 type:complete len:135 (+) Transcript_13731:75-479(+)